jgi:hypothetical protein
MAHLSKSSCSWKEQTWQQQGHTHHQLQNTTFFLVRNSVAPPPPSPQQASDPNARSFLQKMKNPLLSLEETTFVK